jgi:hypothetical protein
MTKKNFKGGLNSLLGDQPKNEVTYKGAKKFIDIMQNEETDKPKRGRPVTQTKEITKSSQEGTKEKETRATFIMNEELLDKLKAIAYWDRVLIKEVINTALQEHVNNKKPKPRPEEARVKDQEANQRLITIKGNKARLPKY